MKRVLILIIFLMSPMLSFANELPAVVQAHVCGTANPPSKFYTPDQLRAGIGGKLTTLPPTCADGQSSCSADSTCCGGHPADPAKGIPFVQSKCCAFVEAVCCNNGKTCCPNQYHCSATGATCIPN